MQVRTRGGGKTIADWLCMKSPVVSRQRLALTGVHPSSHRRHLDSCRPRGIFIQTALLKKTAHIEMTDTMPDLRAYVLRCGGQVSHLTAICNFYCSGPLTHWMEMLALTHTSAWNFPIRHESPKPRAPVLLFVWVVLSKSPVPLHHGATTPISRHQTRVKTVPAPHRYQCSLDTSSRVLLY